VLSLIAPDHDLAALEVHVLDPDRETLEEAKTAAVEDLGDEPKRGSQMIEERHDLAPGEDRRKMVGPAGTLEAHELRELQAKGKTSAQRAWFWVEAETRRSTARWLRKAVASPAPMSRGWRRPWNAMKARIRWR
jgi:hypothetical protein